MFRVLYQIGDHSTAIGPFFNRKTAEMICAALLARKDVVGAEIETV